MHDAENTDPDRIGRMSLALIFSLSALGCDTSTRHDSRDGFQKNSESTVTSVFDSIFNEIIEPKCLGCHRGPDSPKGVDLLSYDTIIGNTGYPPLVLAGMPGLSSFYSACANGYMPRNAPRLTTIELAAIFDWIKAGAAR